MKSLKTLSIDELLDRRDELLDARADGEDYHLHQIIRIEEMLVRKFGKEEDNEYSKRKITEDLIAHLVKYGTYLKTEYRQDDHSAEQTLRKALKHDKKIPQAHYRLGFLAYKAEDYAVSLCRFQKTLQAHHDNPEHAFKLTKQQEYNANLYLSNSALHIAVAAREASEELSLDIEVEEKHFESLALSPLYDLIAENDEHLLMHAYSLFYPTGTRYCSRKAYETLVEDDPNHVILDFAKKEQTISYRGKHEKIQVALAEVLRILMKETKVDCPAETTRMHGVLTSKSKPGELDTNTYSQTIKRIRDKFKQLGLPRELIVTVPRTEKHDTAYYYDASLQPYIVIQRTDDIR